MEFEFNNTTLHLGYDFTYWALPLSIMWFSVDRGNMFFIHIRLLCFYICIEQWNPGNFKSLEEFKQELNDGN